jgi:phosphoenolpyruvate-protein phosphotransferase/dihydroxyacetone kinase phosphotransfer subunit
MVGLVLVSHSRTLALAVKELVVAMAGPELPIAIAAGAGENHADLGTNGIEIMEAIAAVLSEDGVLVLMDMGSALLSTDAALAFLDDAQRSRVRCGAGPFVEGAVAAGVTASLGRSLDAVCGEAADALRQKVEHLESPPPTSDAEPISSAPLERTIRVHVRNPHGLHARPAARFVREAAAFQAEIQVRNGTNHRGPVSARSLTSLVSLEVLCGHEIEISAGGPDAEPALRALQQAVESGLGDLLTAPPLAVAPLPGASADAPVAVSGGLAIGSLFFAAEVEPTLPQDRIDDPEGEVRKLHQAMQDAKTSIAGEQTTLRKALGKEEAEIFEAQALILEDPALLHAAEAFIRDQHENAALAWAHAYQAVAAKYAALEDEYLRQRAGDIRDIGARVLDALGVTRARVGDLAQPGILVVDDLAPAEVTALPKTVLGVICLRGGRTSHAAILLRGRGVPAIAGAQAMFEAAGLNASSGNVAAAFDGDTGELWINPGSAKLEALHARLEAQRLGAEEATKLSHESAVTTDGHVVAIFANLGHASEARHAVECGAEGVGLFRTEFLFLDRVSAPDEDEQFDALRPLREVMGTRPVIVRTLDIGGDKQVPYLRLATEANPFLGERGLRLCLNEPKLFQTQLRAILRAGHGGDFRIMFPMVAELAELRAARAALSAAHHSLAQSGTLHAWPIPVGVMIEVPSAVILGDQLVPEADFFSIGTNDLTQYILAADRGNPSLTRFQDALHPAVLRMIGQITDEAHRHGKHVGVCGEAAADPAAARLLIGLGVDELSLTPARIPMIKAAIRAERKSDLEALAVGALRRSSAAEVRASG